MTAGIAAARAWLAARALSVPAAPSARWNASVLLGTGDRVPEPELDEHADTRFRIEIYSEEWGFLFSHGGRVSWIRVTDIAFVHGRDDFRLLAATPDLEHIGALLRTVEDQHGLQFRRDLALVRTDLAHADDAIRRWVRSL